MPVAVGMDSRHQGVLYGTGATEHALTVPLGLDTGSACALVMCRCDSGVGLFSLIRLPCMIEVGGGGGSVT